MRNGMFHLFSGLLMLAVSGWCAPPVATVTSANPFQLSGATVPVAGVPSWPVSAGDELTTLQSPALLRFGDGSEVVLGDQTRVALERVANKVEVRLRRGSLQFRLQPKSKVAVSGLELPALPANAPQGSLWVDRNAAYLALPTAAHPKNAVAHAFDLGYLHASRPLVLESRAEGANNWPPDWRPPGWRHQPPGWTPPGWSHRPPPVSRSKPCNEGRGHGNGRGPCED